VTGLADPAGSEKAAAEATEEAERGALAAVEEAILLSDTLDGPGRYGSAATSV
jgi:hypothetical protein